MVKINYLKKTPFYIFKSLTKVYQRKKCWFVKNVTFKCALYKIYLDFLWQFVRTAYEIKFEITVYA